jgi:uncharacterized membrane protein YccC
VIEFAASIGFIIAAFFAVLWWRDHSRLHGTLLARDTLERSRAGLAAMPTRCRRSLVVAPRPR